MPSPETTPKSVPVLRDARLADLARLLELEALFPGDRLSSRQFRRHLVQLHVYSLLEDGTHRALFFQALALLKAAGVKVTSWGLDDCEQETRRHHISCTCSWVEPPKQDGQEE